MKKILFLISLYFSILSVSYTQPSFTVSGPSAATIPFGQTNTSVTFYFTYANTSGLMWAKLITKVDANDPYPEVCLQETLLYGSRTVNLVPGDHTITFTLLSIDPNTLDCYSPLVHQQTIKTVHCNFKVRVENNFIGGNIYVDNYTTAKQSPYDRTSNASENISMGAIEQNDGTYDRVWSISGNAVSEWQKQPISQSYSYYSYNKNTSYTTQNGDASLKFRAGLRKNYLISRNDDLSEFDSMISEPVIHIVEQNSGTVSAPLTKTVNGRAYNYIGWTDDYSAANPRTITPVDNTVYTALYKYPEHSNNSAAYANTSSRKVTRTNDGTIWSVYESIGKVWLETSTDNGTTWQTQILNNGADAKTPTITSFNWSVIIAYEIKLGATSGTIKVDYYSSPSTLVNSLLVDDVIGVGAYSTDVNPVIESAFGQQNEGDFIIGWKGNDGLYYSNGACDIYNGLYWRNIQYQKITGTTTGDEYPALAVLKSGGYPKTYHMAFQRSLSIKYCQIIEDDLHNFTYTTIETPSSGSGYTTNTNPSIIVLNDNTPRVAWYGYSKIVQNTLLKGGITILKNAVLRSRQSSGSWYYRFWKFGTLVKQVNINRSADGNYILAWTREGSSDQFIKNSDYSTLHYFSTYGSGIQVVNNSIITDMTAISYSNAALPYQFNQTAKVGTINKTTGADQYAAREGMVLKDEGEFHFIVGDILIDNVPVEFTDISPEQNITNKVELNHYLETKSFDINNSSNLEFSVLFGVIDSVKAFSSLGVNDNVNFKMEMLDVATGQVIGNYDNVTFTKNNLNMYKNISYQVITAGIGSRQVKLRLVVNNNFEAHFILGELFSQNNVLNKTTGKEISFQGTMEVKQFALTQNYPNPFNPSTIIKYQLPKEGFVTLKVYDILGRDVATLVNQKQSIGRYETTFDASKLAAGVYIYRLTVHSGLNGNFTSSKKMILLK